MTSPILELSLVMTALRRVIFVLVSCGLASSADGEFNRKAAAREGMDEYSSNLASILNSWMRASEAVAGVFCPKRQVQLSKVN